MEKFFGGEELTRDEIISGLRKRTIAGEIVPVCCGSSYRNKGVQPMLDYVVELLPSPLDVKPIAGTIPAQSKKIPAPRIITPLLGAGLQNHGRPVCGQAGLLPGIFRQAQRWFLCVQLHKR